MRIVTLVAVVFSLLGCGCVAAAGQKNDNAKPLPSYTSSRAFRFFLKTHRVPEWRPRVGPVSPEAEGGQLLHLTWFLNGRANVAMQLTVSPKGRAHAVRSVYNWAEQADEAWQLRPEELTSLRRDLRGLSPNASAPPLENMVILSFRHGTGWTTRFYDKAKLPETVRKLIQGPPDGRVTAPYPLKAR